MFKNISSSIIERVTVIKLHGDIIICTITLTASVTAIYRFVVKYILMYDFLFPVGIFMLYIHNSLS